MVALLEFMHEGIVGWVVRWVMHAWLVAGWLGLGLLGVFSVEKKHIPLYYIVYMGGIMYVWGA